MEIRYDMYNPLIQKIEVLRLERWLDSDLLFLRDALPEYCTVPFDTEAVPHPPNQPVPVRTERVKLKPPPWHQRWEIKDDYQNIERPLFQYLDWRKQYRITRVQREHWRRMDLMKPYRETVPAEDQALIYEEMAAADAAFTRKQRDESSGASVARRRSLVPLRRRDGVDNYRITVEE